MKPLLLPVSLLALLLNGAIFGFFYAWVCSTMWGLDQMDPNAAIQAMNAMNASVRNAVFFPGFFLTPVALALAGFLAWRCRYGAVAGLFVAAALVYLAGALVLTMQVNVPMNNALALVTAALPLAEAQQVWTDYSATWQQWNIYRTIASGFALLLSGIGMYQLGRQSAAAR